MALFASVLFLVVIILYDEVNIYQEKKKVEPESRKRMAEFNKHFEQLRNK